MALACGDYRMEMMLAGLRRRIQDPGLSQHERNEVRAEIARLEKELGLTDETPASPD